MLFFATVSLNNLFGLNFSKKIFPFQELNFSLIKLAELNPEDQKIVGLGYLFNEQGEILKGTSFIALLQINLSDEYEIIEKHPFPKNILGNFTDFILTELDDDNHPELIVSGAITDPANSISPLFIFNIEDDEFIPCSGFDQSDLLSLSKVTMLLQDDHGFFLLHEDQKTSVCHVSPKGTRLEMETLWTQQEPERYFQSKLVSLERQGTQTLLVRTNHDLLFLLKMGPANHQNHENIFFEPNGNIWDIENLVTGDFNGDHMDEIVIGLNNGGLNMISEIKDSIIVTELFNSTLKFDKLFSFDIDHDSKDNIILAEKKGYNIIHYYYDKNDDSFWDSGLITETGLLDTQFLFAEKSRQQDLLISYLYPELSHHGILKIFLEKPELPVFSTEIKNDQTEPYTFKTIDSLISIFSKMDGQSDKIQPSSGHEPIVRIMGTFSPAPEAIMIEPGELYTQKVDLFSVTTGDLNFTINAPAGFRFNLVERTFEWIPGNNQLGYHHIHAKFYWKDVEIKKELTIYVNDPVRIINKLPLRSIIQAGETFQYHLVLQDRNIEDYRQIKLVKYPSGANIDKHGMITWRSYESQKDWNDFEIQVTDQFSTDSMEFSIFVNHPVYILGCEKQSVVLDEQYNCPVKIKDKNTGFFLNQYQVPPKVENWQNTGIYETMILSNQAKNDIPGMISAIQEKNISVKGDSFIIQEAMFENNKLVIVFTYNQQMPEFSQIIYTFFNFFDYDIPNHTSFSSPGYYTYTLRQGPENLFITKNGMIKWKPDITNLGKNRVSFTVSDGYYSDEHTLNLFVNDRPKILSQPPKFANLNDTFYYPIDVLDRNPEDKIVFELVKGPKAAKISETGLLSWFFDEKNPEREIEFAVTVSDSRDTTRHNFSVTMNQQPVINVPKHITTKINKTLNYKIDAFDPEGTELTFNLIHAPKGLTLQKDMIFWKPGGQDSGNHQINLEASDADSNKTEAELTINVLQSKYDLRTLGLIATGAAITTLFFLIL